MFMNLWVISFLSALSAISLFFFMAFTIQKYVERRDKKRKEKFEREVQNLVLYFRSKKKYQDPDESEEENTPIAEA